MTRVPAKDFEPARLIQDYIDEERARCAALVRAYRPWHSREFLSYCIENSVQLADRDAARKRFDELKTDDDDDIEDLM
jgi:hypothetical protein